VKKKKDLGMKARIKISTKTVGKRSKQEGFSDKKLPLPFAVMGTREFPKGAKRGEGVLGKEETFPRVRNGVPFERAVPRCGGLVVTKGKRGEPKGGGGNWRGGGTNTTAKKNPLGRLRRIFLRWKGAEGEKGLRSKREEYRKKWGKKRCEGLSTRKT